MRKREVIVKKKKKHRKDNQNGKKRKFKSAQTNRESNGLTRRKRKVERREKAFHLFSGKGDQHIL